MNFKYALLLCSLTIGSNYAIQACSPSAIKRQLLLEKWFKAAKEGNLEELKNLVDPATVNAKNDLGMTALMIAASSGHSDIVKYLLEIQGLNINAQSNNKRTALIFATVRGHFDIVKMLLAAPGIDVNKQDNDGDTAFMWACFSNKREGLTKLFLNVPQLNVNAKDAQGSTALHWLARHKIRNTLALLLGIPQINVNVRANNGSTPIMYAATQGNFFTAKMLCEMPGINLNYKDFDGWTALILAAKNGHENIVELLLQSSTININARDKTNHTALNWAKQLKYPLIQALIENKIEELKLKAMDAIKRKDIAMLESVVAQIGIDTIVTCDELNAYCVKRERAAYIKKLLAEFKKSQEEPVVKKEEETIVPQVKKEPTDKESDEKVSSKKCANSGCAKKNCILRCATCKAIYYCCRECQLADWKRHKNNCIKAEEA